MFKKCYRGFVRKDYEEGVMNIFIPDETILFLD
jgi:hypothetical protein